MKSVLTVIIFTILFLANSCKTDTFRFYKDTVREFTQDPKTRQLKGNENDVDNLRGCPILVGQVWEKNGPDNEWLDKRLYRSTGILLDAQTKYFKNLNVILSDNSLHPIYIGPWHYSPTLQKTIRFFANYPKEGGNIQYQYESQTEENKSIPEKAFSLSPTAKIAPDRFGLCVVKWTAKYGYNSIAETKKVYPKGISGFFARIFRDYELVPTGKIIEAKE
jgi:hypothetical protein